MISSTEKSRLRDIPVEQVAEAVGLNVRRHTSLCPFHDDSRPSLTFNRSKNKYRCYVCGAHGDTIDLVKNVMNLTFHDACSWLAQTYGIALEDRYRTSLLIRPREIKPVEKERPVVVDTEYLQHLVSQPVLNEEAQQFLFRERHISSAVVRWCGLSSCSFPTPCKRLGYPFYDAPSLLIPYHDIDGNVVSVQGRYLGTDNRPRFRFPKGSTCHIYNLRILRMLAPGEPLYVAEGVTDCLALMSAGHKAIAIPSATLLKDDDARMLHDLNLHIYPDNDAPGEMLYQQLSDICPKTERHRLPDDCKDFGEYYKKYKGNEHSIRSCESDTSGTNINSLTH